MAAAPLDSFTKQFLRAFSAYGIPQGFPEEAAHQDLAAAFVDFAASGLSWKELQATLDGIAELPPLEDYYGHIPVGFRSLGRLADARPWLTQTQSAFPDWAPLSYASLAMDQLELGDVDTARAIADDAELLLSGDPLPQLTDTDLVVFTEALGRVFLAADALDKAEQYSNDRMELAEESGLESELRDALGLRAEVLRAQGNDAEAQEVQERADAITQRMHDKAVLQARSKLDEAAHVLAHHYADVISPTVDASASKQSAAVFGALHDVAGAELSVEELHGFGQRVSGVLTSHMNLSLTAGHTVDVRLLIPSVFVRKGFDGGLALMSAGVLAAGLPYFAGFLYGLAAPALLLSEDRGARGQLADAVDRALADWAGEDQLHDERLDQPAAAGLATALLSLKRYEEAERWSREAMVNLGNPVQFVPDDEVRRTRLAVLEHLGLHEEEQGELRRGMARAIGAGRNDPCPCGSGKKFKHCCGRAA